MDQTRWNQVNELFVAALELPEEQRRDFIDARCGDDTALRDEVLAILDAQDAPTPGVGDILGAFDGDYDEAASAPPSFPGFTDVRAHGHGGMGSVYVARKGERTFAIKVPHHVPGLRRRFFREAVITASLTHPSIAQIKDVGVLDDGRPYFVMEFVEGTWITRYADTHDLSVRARVRLAEKVCEAVQFAHERGVIHRDIKPSNILVTSSGEVKLLDFGIAKLLDDAGVDPSLTPAGIPVMTPAYAAPEQFDGAPVSAATDVYALGVVLYELVTRKPRFDASGMTPAAIRALTERAPERPSAIANHARRYFGQSRSGWADLDEICLKAMDADRSRRYQNVVALINDLQGYLDGRPISARRASPLYYSRKFLQRHWKPALLAALIVATSLGQLVFYTKRVTAARDSALAHERTLQRVLDFTTSLFEIDEQGTSPPDSLRAVDLVARGVAKIGTLRVEPEVQAQLARTFAAISGDLDRPAQAESLLIAADKMARTQPDSISTAIRVGLGVDRSMLLTTLDRSDEAMKLVTEVRRMAQALPDTARDRVRSQIVYGIILTQGTHEYGKAIAVLDSAVKRTAQLHDTLNWSDAINSASVAHFYHGDVGQALALTLQEIAIDSAQLGPDNPSLAEEYLNLSTVASNHEDYVGAERYARRALAINSMHYKPTSEHVATSEAFLADALSAQSKYDEADRLYAHALTVRQQLHGPQSMLVAKVTNSIGLLKSYTKDYPAALDDFTRSIAIMRKLPSPDHYHIGVALDNTATVYYEQHHAARAVDLYRQALAEMALTVPATHNQFAITGMRLGRALRMAGALAEAKKEDLKAEWIARAQPEEQPHLLQLVYGELAAIAEQTGDTAATRYRAQERAFKAAAPH